MNVYQEKSRSLWMETEPRNFEPLRQDRTADVVVIGAGIAGLSVAYELLQSGTASVVVLDRGIVGRGMTARTTAHLTPSCDDLFSEVIRSCGEDYARAYFESQAAAVDRIEDIVRTEEIDCDFKRLEAYLFAAKANDLQTLKDEIAACRAVGLQGAEIISEPAVRRLTEHAALRFPNHARFHPLRYLDGLLDFLVERSVPIFADSAVTEIAETAAGVTVRTGDGAVVSAGMAVVATNGPIGDRIAVHAKQAPYRTYAIAAPVDAKDIEDVLYWDTEDPYHYVRLHPHGGGHVLIAGGEDHKPGEADDMEQRLERLERWTRERFPEMGKVGWRWSGQCLIPADYIGYIGRNPGQQRTFIATGDSGQGISTGVLAGMIIGDLIRHGSNRWAEAYDPSRKPAGAISTALGEGLTAVKDLAAHFTGGDVASESELKRGQGGLMRSGLGKRAVCRDEDGALHRLSAACTHAGCAVHWNPFEQCWDCGCHGSHFAPDGEVLNGPATRPLQETPSR